MRSNLALQSLMLYVVDDNDLQDVQTKLLVYKQSAIDAEAMQYSWATDLTSNILGLVMNGVQPMTLDINADQM